MMAKETTKRCWWCNADPEESAQRYEGPHATWCPYYVMPVRPASPSAAVDRSKEE